MPRSCHAGSDLYELNMKLAQQTGGVLSSSGVGWKSAICHVDRSSSHLNCADSGGRPARRRRWRRLKMTSTGTRYIAVRFSGLVFNNWFIYVKFGLGNIIRRRIGSFEVEVNNFFHPSRPYHTVACRNSAPADSTRYPGFLIDVVWQALVPVLLWDLMRNATVRQMDKPKAASRLVQLSRNPSSNASAC